MLGVHLPASHCSRAGEERERERMSESGGARELMDELALYMGYSRGPTSRFNIFGDSPSADSNPEKFHPEHPELTTARLFLAHKLLSFQPFSFPPTSL